MVSKYVHWRVPAFAPPQSRFVQRTIGYKTEADQAGGYRLAESVVVDPTKCVHQLLVEVVPRKKVDSCPTTCERVLLLFSNLVSGARATGPSNDRAGGIFLQGRISGSCVSYIAKRFAQADLLEHCLVRLVESKPGNVHHILVHARHSSATLMLLPTSSRILATGTASPQLNAHCDVQQTQDGQPATSMSRALLARREF